MPATKNPKSAAAKPSAAEAPDAAKATQRTRGAAAADTWAVRNYLELLAAPTARQVDPARAAQRVAALTADIEAERNPLKRVLLIQERMNAEAAATRPILDRSAVEEAFVDAAARYAARRGITWMAWRELGVPAAVLKRAGVPRTRRPNRA